MSFEGWIRQWIARHPLKEPAASNKALFTSQVMARVKALAPAPMISVRPRLPLWGWPRLSFALVAAAGILVAVVALRNVSSGRLAREIAQRAAVLAAFSDGEPPLSNDIEEFATDVDAAEHLMLAEESSSAKDLAWIEQMSNVLNQLDDTAPSKATNTNADPADTGWQDDLDMLDDTTFSTAS